MRHAFTLLGIMTLIVSVGAFFAFKQKVEAPITTEDTTPSPMSLTLSSPVFVHEGKIPSKYTCDAENISPELHIGNVPEGTQSLVLVMDDPDVPKERRPSGVFDHWVVYNISPETTVFPEGGFSGTAGANGRGEEKYTGPCPPPEFQPSEHRYFFKLFATDLPTLAFAHAPTKDEVLTAIEGHILEQTELMGRYERLPQNTNN